MRKIFVRDEQGQALVENALSLILLLTMLLAVIQGARMFNAYHNLSYAARVGSRYAMVRGSKCSGFTSACPAVASDVATYVKGISFLGLNSANLTVTTTWGAAPRTGSTCATQACNDPGDQVTVQVTYPLSAFVIPFIPVSWGSMQSSSTTVITQ